MIGLPALRVPGTNSDGDSAARGSSGRGRRYTGSSVPIGYKFAAFGLLSCLLCAASDSIPSPAQPTVLVELFTSEGCSSCPPADALLERIDKLQPIAGLQIVVMSEHVDYWNHGGWTDPFSSAEFTSRQQAYVSRFSLPGPYTPEMVIDGTSQCVGGDGAALKTALLAAMRSPKLAIRIVAGTQPESVTVAVSGSSGFSHGGDVYAVFAQDAADTDVLRGENGGRKLHNVAIAGKLRKMGKLTKGEDFRGELSDAGFAGQRLIVFAQERNTGKVIGTALYRVPKS